MRHRARRQRRRTTIEQRERVEIDDPIGGFRDRFGAAANEVQRHVQTSTASARVMASATSTSWTG
jgi:hypothetical protein